MFDSENARRFSVELLWHSRCHYMARYSGKETVSQTLKNYQEIEIRPGTSAKAA